MTDLQAFETHQIGDTLVLMPKRDLSELQLSRFEEETAAVLKLLESLRVKSVVLDFAKTDYYGSTALGFFVKVWTRLRRKGGQMAFCNISENELEILRLTKLDGLWPICETREEAIAAVKNAPPADDPSAGGSAE
jgi:anti-sigma B factor antagonist